MLALLAEESMHPYRMQRLIKERGKDLVINVGQRSQLYKTIDRLLDAGLIAVAEVERDAARPQRTNYAITDSGRRELSAWTVDMIATPRRDTACSAAPRLRRSPWSRRSPREPSSRCWPTR